MGMLRQWTAYKQKIVKWRTDEKWDYVEASKSPDRVL